MKKTKHITVVLLMLAAFFSSCKKNKTEIPAATVVYTVGNNNSRPLLQKDGIALPPLGLRYFNADIWGIDVSDNGDIYTFGEEEFFEPATMTNYYYGALWKNGVLQSLASPSSINTYVNDIKIVGNDMHIVGSKNGRPCVWKNNIATNLTDGSRFAKANSIFVNGTDVYAGGYESNSTTFVAKIWKNGTLLSILSDGAYSTYITSIFISGTDIYACGYENGVSNLRPVIWKNGVKSYLGLGAGIARKIIVTNNDVYVAGFGFDPSTNRQVATYWKNATPVTIGQGYISKLNSIAIKDGDVYVAGYEQTLSTSRNVAKYWKNGAAIILSDGAANAEVKSIIVK